MENQVSVDQLLQVIGEQTIRIKLLEVKITQLTNELQEKENKKSSEE